MPGGCNCPGQSCGCAIQAGPGMRVSGTGSVGSPFIISSDNRAVSIDQTSAGTLDLSGYAGDPVLTVNLSANITELLLPTELGTRLELVLRQITGGRTVAWPAGIRWGAGGAPTLGTTAGQALWVELRRASPFWVGFSHGAV